MIPLVKAGSTSNVPLWMKTTEAVWESPSLQDPAMLDDGILGCSEVTRTDVNVWSSRDSPGDRMPPWPHSLPRAALGSC